MPSKCTDCVVYLNDQGVWYIQAWFDNGAMYDVPIDQLPGADQERRRNDKGTSQRPEASSQGVHSQGLEVGADEQRTRPLDGSERGDGDIGVDPV